MHAFKQDVYMCSLCMQWWTHPSYAKNRQINESTNQAGRAIAQCLWSKGGRHKQAHLDGIVLTPFLWQRIMLRTIHADACL